LFGDFIANEKPLYCRIKGEDYFPAFRQWAIDLGIAENKNYDTIDWLQYTDYEHIIKTIIPYSATTQDKKNTNFVSPFSEQNISSLYYRHWLGTDLLGHDVLATILSASRVAFLIGIGATLLAFTLGIFLGTLAGYYGNDKIKLSWQSVFMSMTIVGYTFFIASQIVFYQAFLLILLSSIVVFFLVKKIERHRTNSFSIKIKLDSIIYSLINIKRSIPSIILIFILVAILQKCNVVHLILILGSLSWMNFALLIRGEFLKIKNTEYIVAAKSLGFSEGQILFRHAFPNVIVPTIILAASTVSNLILAESGLSFLGIGLPIEQITWGSLMRQAENNISAWWLAIFPGLCIFIVVVIFNKLAEDLRKELS
jgi:peptide/nickel transport system permease protein